MVILNQGGDDITDAIAAILLTGQWGDDATVESPTDTGLISPIAGTQKTLAVSKTGFTIECVHDLLSTEGNGNTLREFALQTNGDFNRVTTTPVVKDATKDIITTTTITLTIN